MESRLIAQLKQTVGEEAVLTVKEDLETYAHDATATWSHRPDVVVLPTTAGQVARVLKLANEHRIPVTTRGGGTNVSGGCIPVKGGIVLSTVKMDRIIEISKTNLTAIVEAGVVLQDLYNACARQGLFYPPDPQSFLGCTVGGTVAENSGGPRCLKYGVTKQYILGLEVVTASGEIMRLGGLVPKNRMGYELMTLFIGSEGTLGVVTRAVLRLLPMPEVQKTMLALFDDIVAAGEVVSRIIASGVIPAKIEYVDNWVLRRIEQLMPMGLPQDADALLLLQCDGSAEAVEAEAKKVVAICQQGGAREIRVPKDQAEADKLWAARSGAGAAIFSAAHTGFIEDVSVPRDKIAELIRKCREIAQKYDVCVPVVGHAGDGNVHPNVLTDDRDPVQFEKAKKAKDEILATAIELGGALSGEHGIGLDKQHFMPRALDPAAFALMKQIKKLLDPNGILNPGKLWPEASDGQR
ncbi:MAG: FAD-binding protein [Chloroflexi bacterium]|nr:FAD-binding protein [Chloroflexota bacterium]